MWCGFIISNLERDRKKIRETDLKAPQGKQGNIYKAIDVDV